MDWEGEEQQQRQLDGHIVQRRSTTTAVAVSAGRFGIHFGGSLADTRKRRDLEEGSIVKVGVVRHRTENFDSAKLHLGCLVRHASGCQKDNSEPKQACFCSNLSVRRKWRENEYGDF